MDIAIHINTSLSHQREHGELLEQGFKRHGLTVNVTADILAEADIHVVSGPHYAKAQWLNHPKVILLDRCYYRGDPEHVSLGWMKSDGSRDFHVGCGRKPPPVKDRTDKTGTIFLADYSGPLGQADTVRLHPARERPADGLREALRKHGIAIGYKTTALVTAALEGLEVICKDKSNIMAEDNWLELLPYADWHYSEIASGEAWEHLKHGR